MRKLAFLALLLAFLSIPDTFADCNNLRIQQLPSSVDLTGNSTPSVTFRIDRAGPRGCDYYVACSNNNGSESGSYIDRALVKGSDSLPVQLCLDSACTTICKTRTEASSGEVLSNTFVDGSVNPGYHTLTIYPKIGNSDYPRFGTYSQSFELRVYNGAFNSSAQDDHQAFDLLYTVSRAIDLSVVDSGGAFNASNTSKTLDFGALSAGAQRSADLILKFNAGYQIRLSSTNAGKLKRTGGTEVIPYTLTLDGSSVPLSSTPTAALIGNGTSPAGGQRFPMQVTIGAFGGSQVPGSYQDEITITVISNE